MKLPELDESYWRDIAWIRELRANAGRPGFNEYGLPLHACNGYIQDAHVWAWIRATRLHDEALREQEAAYHD